MTRGFRGMLSIGSLILACGVAQAAQWVSLGKTPDGKEEVLIDVSSLKGAGTVRRAWSKVVVAPHTQTLEGKWVSSFLILRAFDCAEKTVRYEATTTYYDDGTNHYVPADAFPMPWEPVAPETMDDNQMKLLCAWQPSAAEQTSKYASKWVSLGRSNDGTEIFLDAASIKGAGTTWRVWEKTVMAPRTVRGSGQDAQKWVDHYLSLIAFNCAQSLYRFEAITTYYDDGSDVADPSEEFPSAWTPVPPGSQASAKLDVICTAKVK